MMEISIVITVYKGCADEVWAFEDVHEADKKYYELKKGFNFDENDLRFFGNIDVKEKGE